MHYFSCNQRELTISAFFFKNRQNSRAGLAEPAEKIGGGGRLFERNKQPTYQNLAKLSYILPIISVTEISLEKKIPKTHLDV